MCMGPFGKPGRLRKGDLVGLVAPASAPSSFEKVHNGIVYIERMGYRVRFDENMMRPDGYLSADDAARSPADSRENGG